MQEVTTDRVQRRERLVHQEHVRFLSQGTRERGALFHAARELVGPPPFEPGKVHAIQQLVGNLLSGRCLDASQLQRQLDVACGGQPGQ